MRLLSRRILLLVACIIAVAMVVSHRHRQSGRAPGFQSRSWLDDNYAEQKYVLFVPYDLGAMAHPPVILFLNGLGENNNDGFRQARANFGPAIWEKRSSFPFLAVFTQCNLGKSWADPDGTEGAKALAILDEVIREFSADPDRVYLTGPSAGGSGVWHLAGKQPERFAAIVPLCADCEDFDFVDALASAGMPIWSMWCFKDSRGIVDYNRSLIRRLRTEGNSPIYTETPTPDFHHDCWNYGYRLPPLYEWLLDQRRNARPQWSPKFSSMMKSSDWAGWDGASTRGWNVNATHGVSSIMHHGEGHTDARLTSRLQFTSVDLHFEFKSDAPCHSRLRLSDDSSTLQLFVDICPPALGDGGVYLNAEATPFDTLEPVGQAGYRLADWNDIRLTLDTTRLVVRLNGWKIVDAPRKKDWPDEFRVAFDVAGTTANLEAIWRDIRYRSLSAQAR